MNRRTLLGLSAAGAAGVVAGCSTPQAETPGQRTITWWDHNVNLQKANGAAYEAFTAKSGIAV
jgi:ABC-type glycerol-3-phosphate transport system substrate-binding protein